MHRFCTPLICTQIQILFLANVYSILLPYSKVSLFSLINLNTHFHCAILKTCSPAFVGLDLAKQQVFGHGIYNNLFRCRSLKRLFTCNGAAPLISIGYNYAECTLAKSVLCHRLCVARVFNRDDRTVDYCTRNPVLYITAPEGFIRGLP